MPAAADNIEGSDSWIVRTVRRGDVSVEVSLIAHNRKLMVYKILQYSLLALITLVSAFVPMLQQGTVLLNEGTSVVVDKCHQWGWCATAKQASADGTEWWIRQILELTVRLVFAMILGKFLPQYTVQESILVVRGLGVQLRSVFTNGSSSYQFIDASSVKAIIVNEGIQTCDVRYYMAIVVAGQKKLVLTFQSSRPRLPILSRIYRDVHTVMFPGEHIDDEIFEGLPGRKSQ
jgi:hypothetical protein